MPRGGVLITDCFSPGGPPPWSTGSCLCPGAWAGPSEGVRSTGDIIPNSRSNEDFIILAVGEGACPRYPHNLFLPHIPPSRCGLPRPPPPTPTCKLPVTVPSPSPSLASLFSKALTTHHLTSVCSLLGPLLEDGQELLSVLFIALSHKNLHSHTSVQCEPITAVST